MTEYTPYYQDILFLYRTGISQGSGADGAFHPQEPITRGALAAMLTRMVDPALRVTLSWTVEPEFPSAAGTTLSSLIPAGTYIAAPTTAEEMDQSIRYMLAGGQNTLSLRYDSLTPVTARQAMEQALATVKTYCEQCYNTVSCTYRTSNWYFVKIKKFLFFKKYTFETTILIQKNTPCIPEIFFQYKIKE